jgi:hypothetical protein
MGYFWIHLPTNQILNLTPENIYSINGGFRKIYTIDFFLLKYFKAIFVF